MQIQVRQINQADLALFVQQNSTGSALSGAIFAYFANSGDLGPLVVTTTGSQIITGLKVFRDSPRVPYSGTTGSAPSAQWVLDQIGSYVTLDTAQNITAAKTFAVPVTVALPTNSGHAINAYYLSGVSGVLAAAGGGISLSYSGFVQDTYVDRLTNQAITGVKTFSSSPLVPTPTAATAAVNLTYLDGVSGVLVAQMGGGGVNPTGLFVPMTGDVVISGVKTFTGSPQVPVPTLPSGAANLLFVSGVSGVLSSLAGSTTNNYFITGTGIVVAMSTGTVTNTFSVTSGNMSVVSSGTVNNTFNAAVNNITSIGTVTGNFVNIPFFWDAFSLVTGLNQVEAIIGRSFTFTGWGAGAVNTGTQGTLTGSFYQRTATNTKTVFCDFSLNSGTFYTAQGGFGQTVSGMNRVGVDIYRIGTGITGFSLGLFGFGT